MFMFFDSFLFFVYQGDIHDHLSIRRSSYNVESLRSPKHGIGSASKVDILRSALEINHKSSNNSVLSKADNRTSNQSLGRNRADSAPKLNHTTMKNISQPALEAVVLEVKFFFFSFFCLILFSIFFFLFFYFKVILFSGYNISAIIVADKA